MQVLDLEPLARDQITVSYDPQRQGHFARGFLISTKKTLPAPQGEFQISRETGHEMVKSFVGTDFMIDAQLLRNKDDGHFYGHGLPALLEGYRKKSHGRIERVLGPYEYNDGSGDYWYDFEMRLRDSGAAAALQEFGAQCWSPFSVSPHIWDYPELNQSPLDLRKWRGVGVALVMRGAFGPQAVITRFCKGSSDVCYSDKGLGAALNQKCEAGCECQVCKMEDAALAGFLTSHLGKTGFLQSDKTLEPNSNNPSLGLESQQPKDKVPIPSQIETQQLVTSTAAGKSPEVLALEKEIENLKTQAKLEAEKEWKDKVTALETESKMRTLNEIFSIVGDDNARKVIIDKYKENDKIMIDTLKSFSEDFKAHYKPAVKKGSEEQEQEEEEQEEGGEPTSKAAPTAKTKEKGKSASASSAEVKHPLPKKDMGARDDSGKSASGSMTNRLALLRSRMAGAMV